MKKILAVVTAVAFALGLSVSACKKEQPAPKAGQKKSQTSKKKKASTTESSKKSSPQKKKSPMDDITVM
jgi:uncharacterized protein YxeA